jgi:plasmid maintenance system antidote protein VapI
MPATLPDTETDANVRDYVNAKLAAKKLSKTELARAIGMSPWQLSRRINGHYPFSTDEVVRLARYFHVSVDKILRGKP